MKQLRALFSAMLAVALALILTLASCSKDKEDDYVEDPWANITLVKTSNPKNVTDNSALLTGQLNLDKLMGQNYAAGFVYSHTKSSKDDLKQGKTGVIAVEANDFDNEEFSAAINDLTPETKYFYRAYVKLGMQYYYGDVANFTTEQKNAGNPAGAVAVDMGLPSGTKWADRNLKLDPDATSWYVQWGGLSDYDWRNRPNNLYRGYTFQALKYQGIVDSKGNLTPEHDAAHVLWGGKWRMPTKEEFEELLDPKNCNWVKEYNGYGNSWAVYRVVSRTTGNSIFLDAAGFYDLDQWVSDLFFAAYWTATADTTTDGYSYVLAWANEYYLDHYYWNPTVTSSISGPWFSYYVGDRSYSCYIRPVCD